MKLSFEEWMKQVNKELEFISCDDLPDIDYRSMYEDLASPREAAIEALENAGFDSELCFAN